MTIIQGQGRRMLLVSDMNRQVVFRGPGWLKVKWRKKTFICSDPNNPWGTCCTAHHLDLFINCYLFITESANHWFTLFYQQVRANFLKSPLCLITYPKEATNQTLNFNKKWWHIAFMLCLDEFVFLLADCSTDCDCSKRCSLAFTDWDSTVARS